MVRERLKSMSFDGDIIITDPCYITKEHDTTDEPKWDDYMSRKSYRDVDLAAEGLTKEQIADIMQNEFRPQYDKMQKAYEAWDKAHPDDWEVCQYGDKMSKINCIVIDD